MIVEDKDKLFYYIGTGLLIIALAEVTVLPALLYRFLPEFIIPQFFCVKVVGTIYLLAFLFYLFSEKYFARKVGTIFTLFILFVLFQIYIQQNW